MSTDLRPERITTSEEAIQVSQNAESLRNRAGVTSAFEFITGGGLGYLALKSGLPVSIIEGAASVVLLPLSGVEARIAVLANRAAERATEMGNNLALQQEKPE